jgi:hypothetical protein
MIIVATATMFSGYQQSILFDFYGYQTDIYATNLKYCVLVVVADILLTSRLELVPN